MDEQRTRTFTNSGTDIVDIDGVKLHARWRVAGTQQYVVGTGTAVDGQRVGISLTIYFNKLPDESGDVRELLDRIAADFGRPIAVDLGRSRHPVLYCRELLQDQSGNPIGIAMADQPTPVLRTNAR